MMHRYSLLLGVALTAVAAPGHAQSGRSREDLLDELTRHIQICSEITDTQQRLACYDKVQTHVGDVPAPAAAASQPAPMAATPTPLGNRSMAPAPQQLTPQPLMPPSTPTTGGSGISGTPLAPPPLTVPGGGVATLGGAPTQPAPSTADPDRAFDPTVAAGAAGMAGPPPQPMVRRTGPRPVPPSAQQLPLITLSASNLTYGDSRYWQVSVSITSNTTKQVDVQVQCSFRNAGRSVGEGYFGPAPLAPGEQIQTEVVGPPTSAYVDSVNCRSLSP